MNGLRLNEVRGQGGRVTIPSLAATVGIIASWKLVRREETLSGTPRWTLHAALSYVNEVLWRQESLNKRVIITMRDHGKDMQYRLDGSGLSLDGLNLLMEDCETCLL